MVRDVKAPEKPCADIEVPIIQYWDTDDVPDYIARLTETFADLNPRRRHLLFNEQRAEQLIRETFSARELAAFRSCEPAAMQADYFRYCAILALGGIYADADFRCVGDLGDLISGGMGGRLFRGPKGNVLNGAFAFGAAGHPFLRLTLEIATANIEGRISDQVYFVTGPPIFTTLASLHWLGSFDALLARVSGSGRERFVRSYCDTIGDYDRVTCAFEGVGIVPVVEWQEVVRPVERLPHQCSEAHWTRSDRKIFREPDGEGR